MPARRTPRPTPFRMLLALVVGALALAGALVPAGSAAAADLPAGSYLFAGVDGQLAAIDRVSGTVAASLALPGAPTDVQTGAASGNVYAVLQGSIYVVNATSVTLTRTITSSNAGADYVSVAVSPDGARLYALDQRNNLVDVYDPRSGAPVSSIPVLAQSPWTLEISPDGASVYVVYSSSPTLTVINTAFPPGVSGNYPLPSTGEAIVFDAAGQTAYVLVDPPAGGGTNSSVAVVNTTTKAVTATWASAPGGLGSGMARSPDGSRLYIVNQASAGTLVVIDTTNGSILRTVATGFPAPNEPRVSADGLHVYVAETGNRVVDFDTSTFATRPIATPADVNAISLVDLAAPIFESSNADTFVAGVAHQSGVVTAAFPRATLSVVGTLPTGVTFKDNGDGTGTFSGTATLPGEYLVTITAKNSVGQSSQPYTITVVPGQPAALEATVGGGQTAAPNSIFPTQVKATLRDSVGNPIPNGSVTFTISPAGAATFSGVPSYTASTLADGTVVAPFVLAGSTPGQLSVVATYAGLTPATFPLTISSGTPPGPPTITAVTPGEASAQVAFAAGSPGSGPTTGYRVIATDTTDAARGGQTVEGSSSPITVPNLTNGDTYTFTVTALSGEGNSAPSAPSSPVVIGAPVNPPQPPAIESLETGDGFVKVTFVPGAPGGRPTTGYVVTATDATAPSRGGQTAQGSASPITVTGLTNADAYSFTVTALSASGNSAPSEPSALINVGVPAAISGTPPRGTEGVAYSYQFTLSGAPAPTLTTSGTLPPGLTLDQSGLLHGTPTTPGSYPVTIEVANGVGQGSVSPTVVIGNALGGSEPTPTTSPTSSPTTSTTSSTTSTTTSTTSASGGATDSYSSSSGSDDASSSSLARTGPAAMWTIWLAVVLIAIGAGALVLSRRRRTGDSD